MHPTKKKDTPIPYWTLTSAKRTTIVDRPLTLTSLTPSKKERGKLQPLNWCNSVIEGHPMSFFPNNPNEASYIRFWSLGVSRPLKSKRVSFTYYACSHASKNLSNKRREILFSFRFYYIFYFILLTISDFLDYFILDIILLGLEFN